MPSQSYFISAVNLATNLPETWGVASSVSVGGAVAGSACAAGAANTNAIPIARIAARTLRLPPP
jgi:hypothetical protein